MSSLLSAWIMHRSLCGADGNEMQWASTVWHFAGLSHLIVSQQPVPFWTEKSWGDRQQTESHGLLKTRWSFQMTVSVRNHAQSPSLQCFSSWYEFKSFPCKKHNSHCLGMKVRSFACLSNNILTVLLLLCMCSWFCSAIFNIRYYHKFLSPSPCLQGWIHFCQWHSCCHIHLSAIREEEVE